MNLLILKNNIHKHFYLSILTILLRCNGFAQFTYHEEVTAALKTSCVIIINVEHPHYVEYGKLITQAFVLEPAVTVESLNLSNFRWNSGRNISIAPNRHKHSLHYKDTEEIPLILHLPKFVKDRKCLLSSRNDVYAYEPKAEGYWGELNIKQIVDFINEKCFTFRLPTSHLDIKGLHREHILNNLYRVREKLNTETFHQSLIWQFNQSHNCNGGVFNSQWRSLSHMFVKPFVDKRCSHIENTNNKFSNKDLSQSSEVRLSVTNACEEIQESIELNEFRDEYLFRSKPVILRGAATKWRAIKRWNIEYLVHLFGNRTVHIKLAEDGNFEGVEPLSSWGGSDTFQIPEIVRRQLPYPDCSEQRRCKTVSAYLEYSSIPQYMPELEADISEFVFMKGLLKKKHLNAWLSNGDTLGKLHFDPFDNLLTQIHGSKELILFGPHNNHQLYEGHIQQAMLDFNSTSGKFVRSRLSDSTSMVMSPVDIKRPDMERFADIGLTYPLRCEIQAGDVLYLPAYWWHEVQSRPGPAGYNMAVNYWYEPFLDKEFPCPECQLHINPAYRLLL